MESENNRLGTAIHLAMLEPRFNKIKIKTKWSEADSSGKKIILRRNMGLYQRYLEGVLDDGMGEEANTLADFFRQAGESLHAFESEELKREWSE